MSEEAGLVRLVEDDAALMAAQVQGLRLRGFAVEPFAAAEPALAGVGPDWPGVILSDVRMPGMDGLDFARAVRALDPELPVILLTGHGNVEHCRRAFKQGACEFLQKPVDDDVLLEAVQLAVRQHSSRRASQAASQAARDRLARLSGREHDVLQRIAEGMSNKAIARELELSPRTVETYRANVFAKLEVDTLAQLIRDYWLLRTPPAP